MKNRFFLITLTMVGFIALLYYGGRSFLKSELPAQSVQSAAPEVAVVRKAVKESVRSGQENPVVAPVANAASSPSLSDGRGVQPSQRTAAQLLQALKAGQDDEASRETTLELLNLLESDQVQSRQEAFEILLAMKDRVQGENLQEVFKRMHHFGEEGGNTVIVDSFLNRKDVDGHNRTRLLSYLDPAYPLDPEAVGQLAEAYQGSQDEGLRQGIVHAMARAGDEEGAAWIIDRANQSGEFSEWETMINSLAFSESETAFNYLHKTLNTLVPESPTYKEHMEILRQAISNLDRQRASRQ